MAKARTAAATASAPRSEEPGPSDLPLYEAVEPEMPAIPVRLRAFATRYQKRLAEDPGFIVPTREDDFRSVIASNLSAYLLSQGVQLGKADTRAIVEFMVREAFGLGPLDSLINDPDVTEIMVNGCERILVEADGRIHRTNLRFEGEDALLHVIRRMAAGFSRRIDASDPMVDGVLPDGSRMNAILYPVSKNGSALTIRKFKPTLHDMADLVAEGSLSPAMAEFLAAGVKGRINILVSGGTATGKTTTLNVLAGFIPPEERVITIEDVTELRLKHPFVVSLEYRPPNVEGRGELTIRRLLRNALRMRPDRIIVGEVRGDEAVDMLQAMNTGHDGSMSTIHANSAYDAFSRLETMAAGMGEGMSIEAVQAQVAAAIQLVVHQAHLNDGSRRIVEVSEMLGYEEGRPVLRDIFRFHQEPRGGGRFEATGYRPELLATLTERGVRVPHSILLPGATRVA